VIAGVLAGLAGYLGAAQFGFVNPAHIGWRESGRVLIVVILGGCGTLWGPIIGAFVIILLEDVVSGLTEHWLLLMGGFVIGIVLLLPGGIAGLISKFVEWMPNAMRSGVLRAQLPPAGNAPDG
jgi:branched-chain amino acid transport system permease protein